ncbi:M48 family metallopeptidase [Kytococcus sedentarius]|uniref:M48 metallopeptidase family protein n=1 Tax=Kytococcus sedentarius TaxID=1276 RepID=UPI0035BC2F88
MWGDEQGDGGLPEPMPGEPTLGDPVPEQPTPMQPTPGEPAPDQPEVVITRSARRRKTLSARWVDGVVQVAVPAGMPPQAEADAVHALVQKLVRRRENAADQGALERRAHRLNRAYFEGLATPAEIRWVTNQQARWGSCHTARRTIRISDSVQGMPDWVVDAVVVHELAHLVEANHGPAFKALVERYPRYGDAMTFLAGVSHGWNNPQA